MNRQMDTGHENDNVNHRRYDAKYSYKTNDDDFSVNQNTHGDSDTYILYLNMKYGNRILNKGQTRSPSL